MNVVLASWRVHTAKTVLPTHSPSSLRLHSPRNHAPRRDPLSISSASPLHSCAAPLPRSPVVTSLSARRVLFSPVPASSDLVSPASHTRRSLRYSTFASATGASRNGVSSDNDDTASATTATTTATNATSFTANNGTHASSHNNHKNHNHNDIHTNNSNANGGAAFLSNRTRRLATQLHELPERMRLEVRINKILQRYCDLRRFDDARKLIADMRAQNAPISLVSYNILLNGMGAAHKLEQAKQVLEEARSFNFVPNVVTWTTLVHAFASARRVADAEQIFDMMVKAGVRPTVITYNALMSGYAHIGDIEKARELLTKMQAEGVSPSIFTYTTVISALAAKRLFQDAEALLNELLLDTRKPQPNYVTFMALLNGYANAGRFEQARDVLQRMRSVGIPVDAGAYNCLVTGYVRHQQLSSALAVVEEMSANDVAPTTEIYTSLIEGFGRLRDLDGALRVFSDMVARNLPIDSVVYDVLVKFCARAERYDLVHVLIGDMKRRRLPMSASTHAAALMHAACHDTNASPAERLTATRQALQEMIDGGVRPNSFAYNIALYAACAAQDWATFDALLADVKRDNLESVYTGKLVRYRSRIRHHPSAQLPPPVWQEQSLPPNAPRFTHNEQAGMRRQEPQRFNSINNDDATTTTTTTNNNNNARSDHVVHGISSDGGGGAEQQQPSLADDATSAVRGLLHILHR